MIGIFHAINTESVNMFPMLILFTYILVFFIKTINRKYLNANAKKKDLIFNELNIKWDEELTIVEGPLDLVKCNYNETSTFYTCLCRIYVPRQFVLH